MEFKTIKLLNGKLHDNGGKDDLIRYLKRITSEGVLTRSQQATFLKYALLGLNDTDNESEFIHGQYALIAQEMQRFSVYNNAPNNEKKVNVYNDILFYLMEEQCTKGFILYGALKELKKAHLLQNVSWAKTICATGNGYTNEGIMLAAFVDYFRGLNTLGIYKLDHDENNKFELLKNLLYTPLTFGEELSEVLVNILASLTEKELKLLNSILDD